MGLVPYLTCELLYTCDAGESDYRFIGIFPSLCFEISSSRHILTQYIPLGYGEAREATKLNLHLRRINMIARTFYDWLLRRLRKSLSKKLEN